MINTVFLLRKKLVFNDLCFKGAYLSRTYYVVRDFGGNNG